MLASAGSFTRETGPFPRKANRLLIWIKVAPGRLDIKYSIFPGGSLYFFRKS
jgi:hypothetical protein